MVWKAAQKNLCDCVPYELLPKRHREALEYFYGKYAPESAGKIDGLMKKYSQRGNEKFALLMLGLHQKYRHAVNVTTLSKEQMEKQAEMSKAFNDKMNGITEKTKPRDEGTTVRPSVPEEHEESERTTPEQDAEIPQAPGQTATLLPDPPKPVPTFDEL